MTATLTGISVPAADAGRPRKATNAAKVVTRMRARRTKRSSDLSVAIPKAAEAQEAARAARSESPGVDAVTTGEGRHHERQELVTAVRPAGRLPEVKVLVNQLAQAQVLGQSGRQQQPGVAHQAVVVEAGLQAVEGVR